jgi:peroxiredoxin Q/BCP
MISHDPSMRKEMTPHNTVPKFHAFITADNTVTNEFFQKGKYIFYFYPKDNTPGCTTQACDFRNEYANFQNREFDIYGISKDSIESHEKFKEKKQLPFTLLSDPDGNMCEAFQVWVEKSFLGKKYMGIQRSTFVIVDGMIIHEWRDLSVKGHIQAVLETIKKL